MTSTAVTVLDHIDNITVPGAVFEQPANEYWALLCLWEGLEFLHHQALRCDETAKNALNPRGDLTVTVLGNHPGLNAIPKKMLTCAFHWYAVSACQYVRTVGAIAYREDSTRPLPPRYVEAVIPEVLAFRDKVAAHFAWSTQNSRDNDAERLASILPPIGFQDDSIHVGTFSVALRRDARESISGIIAPWSICKVHERLRARYWPESKGGDSAG